MYRRYSPFSSLLTGRYLYIFPISFFNSPLLLSSYLGLLTSRDLHYGRPGHSTAAAAAALVFKFEIVVIIQLLICCSLYYSGT